MARTSKLPTMRIITAVNARCYPSGDVREAFFVDGRNSGQRDMRMVDRLSEREDSSFVQTIFAYPEKNWSPERNIFAGMQDLANRMAQGDLDWDGEEAPIDYLGDCAVTLLSGDGIRGTDEHSPFFGGVTICGDEFAALTMGKVCAVLYRDRILYPLVGNENWLEPVDLDGQPVEQFRAFIGDSQVPLRSSLVAKALPEDLILLCNVELAQTLGQRNIMETMAQVSHPGDIAEQLVGEASRQKLGMPMICLVSQVTSVNKTAGTERKQKSGFTSRFNVDSLLKTSAAATSAATIQNDFGDVATKRYDPSALPPAAHNMNNAPAFDSRGDSEIQRWDKNDEALGTQKIDFSRLDDEFDDRRNMQNQCDEYDEQYDEAGGLQGFWKRGYWIILGLLVVIIIGAVVSLFISGGKSNVDNTTNQSSAAPKISIKGPIAVPPSLPPSLPSTSPGVTVGLPVETAAPQADGSTIHTVVAGDTLWGIASKYYGANKADEATIDKIRKANNITGDNLQIGQKLTIPKN